MTGGRLKITRQEQVGGQIGSVADFHEFESQYANLGRTGRNIQALRFGDQIVLIMSESFAGLISDETEDGCSDARALYDALAEIGIGKQDYDVDVRIEFKYNTTLRIEAAKNEEEAGEQAVELVKANLSDYVDTGELFEYCVTDVDYEEVNFT
jgi:hypothetical protein